MADGDVGDLGAARRMDEGPARADVVAGQGDLKIVASERVEARSLAAIGQVQRSVNRQVVVIEAPLPARVAEEQRHVADRRPGIGERPANAAPAERALQPCSFEREG